MKQLNVTDSMYPSVANNTLLIDFLLVGKGTFTVMTFPLKLQGLQLRFFEGNR